MQGGHSSHNGWQSQISIQNCLTCVDIWHWQVDPSVSRSKIDEKPNKLLLDLYYQKGSGSREHTSNLNDKNRVIACQSVPRLEPIYRPRSLKQTQSPLEEGAWTITKNVYCYQFSQPSPKKPIAFTGVTVHWGKGKFQNVWVVLDTGYNLTLILGELKHYPVPQVRIGAYGGQGISKVLTHICLMVVISPALESTV